MAISLHSGNSANERVANSGTLVFLRKGAINQVEVGCSGTITSMSQLHRTRVNMSCLPASQAALPVDTLGRLVGQGRPCMESLQLCNVAGLRRLRRSSEIHIWLPWLRSADAHWRRSSSKPRPLAASCLFHFGPLLACSAPVVPPPHPRKADGETLDLAAARSRCWPPPPQTKHMATGRLLSYIVVSTTL